MDYRKKIDEVIDQALTEKTFSLEIIEKIKSLRDGFQTALEKIDILEKNGIHDAKIIIDLRQDKEALTKKVNDFTSREGALAEKEKQQDKSAYELDFQRKRAEEIKELVSLVFRNSILKETSWKSQNIPVPNGSGYHNMANGSENETKESKIE